MFKLLKEIEADNTRVANDLGILNSSQWADNKSEESYYFRAEKYLLQAIEKNVYFTSENLGTLYFRKWESNKSSEFYFKKVDIRNIK